MKVKFFKLMKIIFLLVFSIATIIVSRTGFQNSQSFHKNSFFSHITTLDTLGEISTDLEETDHDFIYLGFLFNYLASPIFSICIIVSYFYITPKSLICGYTNLPPPSI